MTGKCSWPYCTKESVTTINVKYINGFPQIELCQKHYDRHITADSCWEKIIKTEGYKETIMVFDDSSLSIFREALLMYSMGLNASVALLCRAFMESAMHAYISYINPRYQKLPIDNSVFMHSVSHDLNYNNMRLKELIKYLIKNNILVNMVDKINFVKENGDFVAHYSKRFMKSWDNAIKNNKIMNPIKLWVSDDEAKKSLIYTSGIISELIHIYYITTKP